MTLKAEYLNKPINIEKKTEYFNENISLKNASGSDEDLEGGGRM